MFYDAMALAGIGLLFVGLYEAWRPLAFIVSGLCLIAICVVTRITNNERGRTGPRNWR